MAVAAVCITLVSCKSNSTIYYLTYNTDIMTLINDVGLGGVIQINDPANFPDVYYTLSAYCNVFNPGCDECTNPENDVVEDIEGVLFQYWSSYGIECPQIDPTNEAYVLLNCTSDITFTNPEDIVQSPTTALVTSTDLNLYVNMVIKIEEYPDYCYTVLGPYTTDTGCPCDLFTVLDGFEDCACCLPEPEVDCCEKPKYSQKPVKNYFRITDSDCDIKVNTKFANNYYRLFTGIKYGIQNCCSDIDFEKLWLQKEMADYQKINFSSCTTILPELCLYITGNQTCGSQTGTFNEFINGKWSWTFTRESGVEGIIYWDNVNNFWVCEDVSTSTVISTLSLNTDYPTGTNTEWVSVVSDTCLSVNTGLSTWTIPCELCPAPDPLPPGD